MPGRRAGASTGTSLVAPQNGHVAALADTLIANVRSHPPQTVSLVMGDIAVVCIVFLSTGWPSSFREWGQSVLCCRPLGSRLVGRTLALALDVLHQHRSALTREAAPIRFGEFTQ